MHDPRSTPRRWAALAATLLALAGADADAAELYVAGDIGISWLEGDGTGSNAFVAGRQQGSGDDATPVYGAALGLELPLDQALPFRMRLPGRRLNDDFGFPDWPLRFEIEFLSRDDAELATNGVNAAQPYRADVEAWSVMAKLRMDLPVRTPVSAAFGRVPWLDPLSIYLGGGVGIGATDLRVSDSVFRGSDDALGLAWQAIAGFGYRLNERVRWSVGWRYTDFGRLRADLADAGGNPGRYAIDLAAHEFTTSLSFAFWRLDHLFDR